MSNSNAEDEIKYAKKIWTEIIFVRNISKPIIAAQPESKVATSSWTVEQKWR